MAQHGVSHSSKSGTSQEPASAQQGDESNEEREPAPFDLDERPKIPQFMQLGSIRCSATGPSKTITCGTCRRCVVEQQLMILTQYFKQFQPIWQNELFVCFAATLTTKHLQWLLDILKPFVNPVSPTTDDVRDDILAQVQGPKMTGVMVRKNMPFAEIEVLVRRVTDMVEWFQATDTSSREIFLLRFLSMLDFMATLYVCVELEKMMCQTVAIPDCVTTPGYAAGTLNKPPTPLTTSPFQTYLDLSGLGLVTIQEQNIFCGPLFKTTRIYKSGGSVPLVAPSAAFVVVKSKETPEIAVLAIKPAQSKTNPLNPIALIHMPGSPVIEDLVTSHDGKFVFAKISPSTVQSFQYNNSTGWQTGKTFASSSEEETITFIGGTGRHALLVGTSKTRAFLWDPSSGSTDYNIAPEGTTWKDISVVSACITPSKRFIVMSLANSTALLVGLPSACVRKILTFNTLPSDILTAVRNLTASEYFVIGSSGRNACIWEIWSGCSAPRQTLRHTTTISGLAERECRVLTGTKDAVIHVWSVVTGQELHSVKPLSNIGHKLSQFHVVDNRTAVMTFVTGIFIVKFRQKPEMEKTANAPVSISLLEDVVCTVAPVQASQAAWRDRLIALLNEASNGEFQGPSTRFSSYQPLTAARQFTPGATAPFMSPLPLDEAMALGRKGALSSLKAAKTENAAKPTVEVPDTETMELARHREKLTAQMATLQQHNQFGATRQNLFYDKEADIKKTQRSTRQTPPKGEPKFRR